jgi:cell division protein ZapA
MFLKICRGNPLRLPFNKKVVSGIIIVAGFDFWSKNMNEPFDKIKVIIFGKDYEIKGQQDEEYIRTLASYVNSTMQNIATQTGIISLERIAILTALNIADEMHKERQRFDEYIQKLEQELQDVLNAAIEKR